MLIRHNKPEEQKCFSSNSAYREPGRSYESHRGDTESKSACDGSLGALGLSPAGYQSISVLNLSKGSFKVTHKVRLKKSLHS